MGKGRLGMPEKPLSPKGRLIRENGKHGKECQCSKCRDVDGIKKVVNFPAKTEKSKIAKAIESLPETVPLVMGYLQDGQFHYSVSGNSSLSNYIGLLELIKNDLMQNGFGQ